jgi:hypothetical protein
VDEDHLQNFVEHGRKAIAESGLVLGEWLGAGGMGTIYQLKKFAGTRVVKFSAVNDDAAFGWWIMNLRARARMQIRYLSPLERKAAGLDTPAGRRADRERPPVILNPLPPFLPAVYSVRVFALGGTGRQSRADLGGRARGSAGVDLQPAHPQARRRTTERLHGDAGRQGL